MMIYHYMYIWVAGSAGEHLLCTHKQENHLLGMQYAYECLVLLHHFHVEYGLCSPSAIAIGT